jgi:hypothetical protein
MALQVKGNRLVTSKNDPRLLGPIVGCHLEGQPESWPMVCDASLDAIKTAGLNWTGVRTGVFSAEGEAPEFAFYMRAPNGKYDLTQINQAFLSLVRRKAIAAKDRGIYLQVDLPVDRWVRQHGATDQRNIDPWSARNNAQNEEHGTLGIFHLVPDAVHEAAIRAVVNTTCDLPNVIYAAGNEAFKSDSAAFTGRVIALVRECPNPHLVGANSDIGAPLADFTILHQSSAAPMSPRPTVVDEYGPDIPPSAVVDEALKADTSGSYFMYWRGSHSSSEWLATMTKLGQIRAGHSPTPTPGCDIPSVDVPQVTPRPGSGRQIDARNAFVDEAEAFVKASHPELFDASGNLKGWPANGALQSAAAQPYFNLLVDYFRGKGACSSAWEDSVAVGWKGDSFFEEYHTLAFAKGTPIQGRFAYRFSWGWPK